MQAEKTREFRALKEAMNTIFAWTSKGKDEVVQLLCREIGSAMALTMREPILSILDNKKLQITFELVERQPAPQPDPPPSPAARPQPAGAARKAKKKAKKKSTARKTSPAARG